MSSHASQTQIKGVEDIVAFKGQGSDAGFPAQRTQQGYKTLGIHVHLKQRRLGLSLEGEAGVGQQPGRPFGRDEEKAGGLLNAVVRGGVTAEVAAVVGLGNQ